MIHFLIFCPSLSRLAQWTERITVNVEMVGSSLTSCRFMFFKKSHVFTFLIIYFACNLLMTWPVRKMVRLTHMYM